LIRSKRLVSLVAVLVLSASAALAGDPGAAIGQARQALNEKRYSAAIKLLQDAMPDAEKLPEPQHAQALAALHFYSAIAWSASNDVARTKSELEEFFRFSPQTKSIDAAKYDPRFVKAFGEVAASMQGDHGGNFDSIYPGLASFTGADMNVAQLTAWGDGPELTLLGSSDEKRQWRAVTTDEARKAFVDSFWSKRGDAFHKELERHVAFADQAFKDMKTRGSLTDRGRVFILLGVPRVVRLKPLTAREGGNNTMGGSSSGSAGNNRMSDAAGGGTSAKQFEADDKNMTQIAPDPIAKGTVERWIFGRDQLPPGIPDAEVVFKFVTQEGYGDHVLQREFMINKVLAEAATMPR
jgi:GWxTD domain-containing protein